jgi:hypothetical protein
VSGWQAPPAHPSLTYPPVLHDRAVCAVPRHAARAGLGHVEAWDLAAMLGLDVETAVARAQAERKPQP